MIVDVICVCKCTCLGRQENDFVEFTSWNPVVNGLDPRKVKPFVDSSSEASFQAVFSNKKLRT